MLCSNVLYCALMYIITYEVGPRGGDPEPRPPGPGVERGPPRRGGAALHGAQLPRPAAPRRGGGRLPALARLGELPLVAQEAEIIYIYIYIYIYISSMILILIALILIV